MKTSRGSEACGVPVRTRLLATCGIALAVWAWGLEGLAQEAGLPGSAAAPLRQPAQQAGPGAVSAASFGTTDKALATNQLASAGLSAGVVEVVRMADAGVSADVLKAYVECSPTVCQPNDSDIIALKQHGVGDDVVTSMLKRSAKARAQEVPTMVQSVARVAPAAGLRAVSLDPESYEYFQHYYLYPRTLESVYQRVPPYYPAYPYAYGYPSPFGLQGYYPRGYGMGPYPGHHGIWP